VCVAGYNTGWLLWAIARKGLNAFLRLLPATVVAVVVEWIVDYREPIAFIRPSNSTAAA
jgi:hypothetical protein